jgi:hypothetical protein
MKVLQSYSCLEEMLNHFDDNDCMNLMKTISSLSSAISI